MIFALDDVVWQSIINGGYAMLGASFVAYLNYKLNAIAAVQKINAEKITETARSADLAAKKVDVVAQDQKDHLSAQDLKLQKIVDQTNGLTSALVQATSKSAFEAGAKAGQSRRASDLLGSGEKP